MRRRISCVDFIGKDMVLLYCADNHFKTITLRFVMEESSDAFRVKVIFAGVGMPILPAARLLTAGYSC